MAVRVYEIARKFNLPSNQVLEEAAKRNIKVKAASSTIDKITAEWFESELIAAGFQAVAPPEAKKPEPPPSPPPPASAVAPAVTSAAAESPPPPPSSPSQLLPASPSVAEPKVVTPAEPLTATAAALKFTPAASPPSPIFTPKTPAASAPPSPTSAPRPPPPARGPVFRPGPRVPSHSTTVSSAATEAWTAPSPPPPARPSPQSPEKIHKTIRLKPPIIVRDLAAELGLKPFQLIQELMSINVFASINQPLEEEVARQISAQHGVGLEIERRERHAAAVIAAVKKPLPGEEAQHLLPRPPVVTILGHVDHGKTSLLDKIRSANVAAGEAGGITQHIGAYSIAVPSGGQERKITFLDTPGHEAFTKMRARGATVTDIAVLVVAADDGVQPQTVESINHARAANVPIIVALNKCDKPTADLMRVKRQLQEQGLAPEEWGGQTIFCEVSALTGAGIEHLLEMILLQAELLELKANPKRPAAGTVVEAALKQGRGPAATLLVRSGTLRIGDPILAGTHWGKVRAMTDATGVRLKEAPPSTAVEVIGLSGVPEAGVEFRVAVSEKEARERAEELEQQTRATRELAPAPRVTLENLFQQIAEGQRKELKIVLKADVRGSLEAIGEIVAKLPADKVKVSIIHSAVGNISESDVLLASASDAVVVGFHVRPEPGVQDLAEREGVELRLYTIIYELIEEIKKVQEGLLEPVLKEVVLGHAEVRQIFELSRGVVAGCMVSDGRVVKNARARLLRNGRKEYQGAIGTLRRFQDDVNEVRAGLECGLRLADFADYQVGDVIECYQVEKIAQKL